MMQQGCCFAFLCSLLLPSLARSLQCSETQYLQTIKDKPSFCCDMCQPGHYLDQRCSHDSSTQCKPCGHGRYMGGHNVEFSCNFCENCNNSNLEYKSRCNRTHNAVCKCKPGYRCADQACKECLPVPPTTKPTPTPSRTALTPNTVKTEKTTEDTLWLLITLLSIGTAAIGLMKLYAALQSITSKCGYFLAKAQQPIPTCSEDEEVTMPVQEAGNVTKIKMDP